MPLQSVLRHRGIEAWLEDSSGYSIALSGDANIDSNNISTWVNVTPRQYYTLRWRTIAGRNPRSALCEVYVKDGFHPVGSESSELCVSTLIMNSARRTSQSKTTKGWLNPPYNRFGCLRIRRRIQTRTDYDSKKRLKTQHGILSLGSLRLEIRRVSGDIRTDQVYWGKGDDGMGVCVFDPDGIEVIDDEEQGDPPWIIFEFKFREDPKITQMTQHITEENVETKVENYLENTPKLMNGSGALAALAVSEESSTPEWGSDIEWDFDVESNSEPNGQDLGVMLSEEMPPLPPLPPFPPSSCEPEMAPQINEAQQSESSEGGDRALTGPTPHTTTSSSGIVNADNQITPELDISRKGERKMFDQGGDTNASVPAGDGEIKKHHITTVAEEDSDIEYIGSWRPGKIRTKNIIQTTVKMENLPVELENPVTNSDPLPTAVKCQQFEIKLEDLDHKIPIDEMMRNYDVLERQKEELKQKLAVKIEARKMEIDELSRRLEG